DWERLALWHGLPMFFAGIILFHLPKRQSSWMQVPSLIVLVLSMHFGLADAISTISMAGLIYSTQSDGGPLRVLSLRPFLLFGKWSYSIYMIHIPIWYLSNIFLVARMGPTEIFVL